jgi:hypothetical protein
MALIKINAESGSGAVGARLEAYDEVASQDHPHHVEQGERHD